MYLRVVQIPSFAVACQKVFENKPIAFLIETVDAESSRVWQDCHFKVTWI